jgi:rubredoxin
MGIEPGTPGYDLNTFECPRCGQFETSVTKIGAVL